MEWKFVCLTVYIWSFICNSNNIVILCASEGFPPGLPLFPYKRPGQSRVSKQTSPKPEDVTFCASHVYTELSSQCSGGPGVTLQWGEKPGKSPIRIVHHHCAEAGLPLMRTGCQGPIWNHWWFSTVAHSVLTFTAIQIGRLVWLCWPIWVERGHLYRMTT